MFIFSLEAKGSFNVCAASEVQTAVGGRWAQRGAERLLCVDALHPGTGVSAQPEQLTGSFVLHQASWPRLTTQINLILLR